MLRIVSVSGLVGLAAAIMAWVAALVVVGTDEIYVLQGRVFEWGTVIAAMTALVVIGVVLSMYRVVEPALTAVAAAAGCALLYNTREYPFLVGSDLRSAGDAYWTVVISMIVIFIVLLIGLRLTRTNSRNY